MRLLLSYLKNYWKLVLIALVLAAVNQIFSMLDPWIFRIVIDDYATKFDHYLEQFIKAFFFYLPQLVLLLFQG
jgi:ATP-binding cassette subfamily B protein